MGSATARNSTLPGELPRNLGAREHRIMGVDLAGIGGSALTDARVAVPETPTSAFRSPMCRPATPCCCRWRWAGREMLSVHGYFCGCERRRLLRVSRLPAGIHRGVRAPRRLATKAGVEGAAFQDSSASHRHVQGRTSFGREAHSAWTTALTVSCYQADADGGACGKCDSCRLRAAGFAGRAASPIPPAIPALKPRYPELAMNCRPTSAIMRA